MYKVIQRNHYNEYGVCDDTVFYILYVTKFLFWNYSAYLTYTKHYDNAVCKARLSFSTEVEAVRFIKEILIPNKPYDCFVYTEVYSV